MIRGASHRGSGNEDSMPLEQKRKMTCYGGMSVWLCPIKERSQIVPISLDCLAAFYVIADFMLPRGK